jgi:hypothetical protein
MSVLSEKLDKIANSLESKGLIKEAEAIDLIANTLEAFEKEAWSAQRSPIYLKSFAPALEAVKAGNPGAALKALKMGEGMKRALVESRQDVPEFKFFSGLWSQAIASLERGDAAKATEDLEKAYSFLQKIEPIINAENPGYKPQQGQQPGQPAGQTKPSDMIFTSKKIQPGAVSKKPPVLPPARAMR